MKLCTKATELTELRYEKICRAATAAAGYRLIHSLLQHLQQRQQQHLQHLLQHLLLCSYRGCSCTSCRDNSSHCCCCSCRSGISCSLHLCSKAFVSIRESSIKKKSMNKTSSSLGYGLASCGAVSPCCGVGSQRAQKEDDEGTERRQASP